MMINPAKNVELSESRLDKEYDYKTSPGSGVIILLGIQHFLAMCLPNAITSLILVNSLCLEMASPFKSQLISISFFVMGIATFLQTLLGCRLPIIQGATYSVLLPTLSLLNMPEIKSCNVSENEFIQNHFTNATRPQSVFHLKMRLVNGALVVTSLVEIFLAATGLVGMITRLLSPLSLASIYTVLCLAICKSLIQMVAEQWLIGCIAMGIMLLFSIVLAPRPIPIPVWTKTKRWHFERMKIFEMSPVILGLLIIWLICGILTWSGALSQDPTGWGYAARTDIKLKAVTEAPIFQVPFPLQWGSPIVLVSAVTGMTAGIMISIIDSLGDYSITANVIKAPRVPIFAVNRGILTEGFCVFLAGLLGSAVAPTSYSGNVGLIKLTKVGDNWIARVAGLIMIVFGIFPVLGAIFVSIPNPAVSGVMLVISLMILACALDNLKQVNLKSARNPIIFGLSVSFGIYLPFWTAKNSQTIRMGYGPLDDIVQILLSINLFIAAVISIILDNILPKEKNVSTTFDDSITEESLSQLDICAVYDWVPLRFLAQKCPCLQYLPIFPAYRKLETETAPSKVEENHSIAL